MHVQLVEFAPFLSWIRQYGRPYLKADLLAGLTVAVVAVPQSMAYAMIAGLPVQYGLYASIVPTVVSCLWGSSAHLITGPTTAVSLVVFSTVHNLAPHGSLEYVGLIFFLSLLVGALQILMGMARLGNLLNFVSHSVLLGFMAGAAVFATLPLGVTMAQILAPKGRSMVASLMMGLAFGLGGALSPVVGKLADLYSIYSVLMIVSLLPLLSLPLILTFPRVKQ